MGVPWQGTFFEGRPARDVARSVTLRNTLHHLPIPAALERGPLCFFRSSVTSKAGHLFLRDIGSEIAGPGMAPEWHSLS